MAIIGTFCVCSSCGTDCEFDPPLREHELATERCECGGKFEIVDLEEFDRLAAYSRSAATLEYRGG